MDGFGSEEHVRREREKARELRKSRWWQNLSAHAVCYYCQVQMNRASTTMDHIIPLAQGGFSKPGNVVPACKPCNTRKRDCSAVELLLTQPEASMASAEGHHIADDGQKEAKLQIDP